MSSSPAVHVPAPSRVSTWWHGRFGWRLLAEIGAMAALLTLYRLGRYVARDNVDAAFRNAADIVSIQNALGFGNEQALQSVVLDHLWLVKFLNRYYAMAHFPMAVSFLVLTYVKLPDLYKHIRAVFILVTGVGLAMHIAYPLAPPRMLSGYVDTIRLYGPAIYDSPSVASVANQYAAMPSLHVAWAIIVAYGVAHWRVGWWRWLFVLHPVITTIAVVATANHYWLDAIVGGFLVWLAVLATTRAWGDATARSGSPSLAG